MVLLSRVAEGVAHVTQLCIAPTYRGRGLGNLLLHQSAASLLGAGFEAVTLTVTEGNEQAVRLYERFGFTLRHRFDAMVMDTRSSRR
jgi:ribosomal protein S18 acetylase RimI-like enzyme